MEAKWSQREGILGPYWPTYCTLLADLLHTFDRLITHRWPTYYTPLADLLHAAWIHEPAHSGDGHASADLLHALADLSHASTDLFHSVAGLLHTLADL